MEIDTDNHSYNHGQSTCMIPAATNQDDTSEVQLLDDRIFKILIIGASGSGKSTAGNILLGKEHFPVSTANSFISETVEAKIGESERKDRHLLVLDTPDICGSNVNSEDKARRELEKWLNMCPDPHLILFTIRYNPADLQDAEWRFSRFKSLWDEDFIRQRLVVLFTFGNEGAPSKEELQDTRHAGLQEILDYADHRYVIFDLTLGVSEQQERVDKVLYYLDELMMKTIRVVLLGKTGSGKSSLGNTLLGKKAFETSTAFESCTEKCQWGEAQVGETLLKVTDTPGLWDTKKLNNTDILLEIGKSFCLCAPGPHVVIIVLRCDVRFTKEEQDTVTTLREVLGGNLSNHLMVVFTRGDTLGVPIGDMKNALKEKLRKGSALDDFLRSLNNRFCVVANTGSSEDLKINSTVTLNMVQNLMEENKRAFFTNEMIAKCNENVQRFVQERERAERLSREEAESRTMQAIATGTESSGFFETLLQIILAVVAPVIEAVITKVATKLCSVM